MAESQDSLEFYAKYKDWNVSRVLNISDKTDPRDIAAYLANLREEVDNRSFAILGIETKPLDDYAAKITKGMAKKDYSSLVQVYKSLGSAETEEVVSEASANREEIKPFAKAYILRQAMANLDIDFCLSKSSKSLAGNALAKSQKQGTSPMSSDGISFMAKYKDWVSIKKMSIDASTKPEEVSAHLTSIRSATDRKGAEVLGIDTDAIEMYAEDATGNMRKSAANLEKVTQMISSDAARKEIDGACKGNGALTDAARTYLFSTMLKNLKVDFYVNPETLMAMFPGLKIPKPKGRMPGQKSKKKKE